MNPADILKYGHLMVMRTVADIPQDKMEVSGVCGIWSVKDIMAHLASYEHWLEEALAPFAQLNIGNPIMSQISSLGSDGFNAAQVALWKDKTPAEVVSEYEKACKHILEDVYPKVPSAVWSQVGSLPWYGAEYSLDDFIVYTFYGHKREHCAQINVFKDTLKPK